MWERPITDALGEAAVEYLVAGDFPDEVVDGARIGVMIGRSTIPVMAISWQWTDDKGNPVGPEMVVEQT